MEWIGYDGRYNLDTNSDAVYGDRIQKGLDAHHHCVPSNPTTSPTRGARNLEMPL